MRVLDVKIAMIRLHRIHRMRQSGYPLSKECVRYSFLRYELIAKKFIAELGDGGQEEFALLHDTIRRMYPY